MIRYLVMGMVGIGTLGCSGGSSPSAQQGRGNSEVYSVSLTTLYGVYRANPNSPMYLDKTVRIYVPARSYRGIPGAVGVLEAYSVMEGMPGCVRFEFTDPRFLTTDILTRQDAITIIGTVRGIVRDGLKRTASVDYYIRVSDCSATITLNDLPQAGSKEPS